MPTSDDSRARQTVEHFINLHEPSYEPLLHYAALPLILTPELLHYLRHAFTPTTPWIAEVDILLAESLCRQYSTYEQYLLHADVRAWLLAKARAEPGFRLADAARVLLHYVEDLQRSRPYKSWRELQAQAWSAMVYIDDEHRRSAVEQIKEALRRAGATQSGGYTNVMNEAELERLAHLTEQLAPELGQYPELVDYARYVRALVRNETVADDRAYQPILGEDMPSPAELTGRGRIPQPPKVIPPPVKIFVAYSHKDQGWLEKLATGLLPLERQGAIEYSHDLMMRLGEDWRQEIEEQLNSAELILVLVSADFLASEYSSIEMRRALERAEAGEARLIPLILHPVDWLDTPLARLQCLPKDGRPIADWPDPDQALREVVQEIRHLVEAIQAARQERLALPPIQNIHGWSAERAQELQRQTARALGTPVEFRDAFKEDSRPGPLMVVIPGGRFLMGSPTGEQGRSDNERQHEVGITSFAVGKYPVTFEDYDRFSEATGREKPSDKGWGRATRPVIDISWEDAGAYCRWLSEETGARYRLLTEAEWEYTCRAGSAARYCFGEDEQNLSDYAWYSRNSEGNTHPVGEKRANAWGLHDVHGNVWEWVRDWYGAYSENLQQDPSGPETGSYRVVRGGSWNIGAEGCRSACRDGSGPGSRDYGLGFRLARTGPWPSDTLTLAPPPAPETPISGYEPYQGIQDHLQDGSEAPEMVYLPGGTFKMGDIQGKGFENERPVHEVTLDAFAIGRYPVTVGEFRRFVDATGYQTEAEREGGAWIWEGKKVDQKADVHWRNPYFPQTDAHPVVCLSWNDAVAYCKWLSEQTGERYSLPTEAEWEYACRASSEAEYCFGNDVRQLEDYAWYLKNAGGKAHPVGEKRANAWGLYDVHGNVWEWVRDWYGAYSKESQRNPSGPEAGSFRVLRGGSWFSGAVVCRAAFRDGRGPGDRDDYLVGFRLARRI